MKKLLLALVALAISLATVVAQERPIDQSELPNSVRKFVTTYFAKDKINLATVEKEGLGREYKVMLTSGTKIEFDTKGEWKDVECKRNASVPQALIPAKIANYVKAKFPRNRIVSIDQDKRGYDIELDNGIDLEFNKKGELVKFD